MPSRKKRREQRREAAARHGFRLRVPKYRFRHRRGGDVVDPVQPGLEIRLEFELNIEEGDDPVTNETIGDIQQDARSILEQGGQEIVEAAQAAAPVRTGALRASIYYMVEDVMGLTVGATVPYAEFQEYGTRRMAPKFFLTRAVNEHQPLIHEELDQMIAERLAQDTSEDDPEFELERTMEEGGL